jgi:hypothetical protein
VQRAAQIRHEKKLEENYKKAVKRAAKKGRVLPPREQYYNHWGYSYYSESIASSLDSGLWVAAG